MDRVRVPGGHRSAFGRLLDAAHTEEYGADTTDQSSLNVVYLLGYQPNPKRFSIFGRSDERWHVVGGNQRPPQGIATALHDIRTGWRMTAVAANTDGTVTLAFDSPGGSVTATFDRVILTVPFPVLRTLDASEARFDPRRRRAIDELGAGSNAKLLLQFTSRHRNMRGAWGISNGDSYTDLGYQNTWDTTRGQPGASGILVNYTGGSVAAALAHPSAYSTAADDPDVAGYAQTFLAQLEHVYPGVASRWNGRATLSTPTRNPNLVASYPYWRQGQYVAFGGYEGVPQGAIHFAGDHCSQDFQGYMEGAAREGRRAALDVFHALR
jgi:monoamine oxidase